MAIFTSTRHFKGFTILLVCTLIASCSAPRQASYDYAPAKHTKANPGQVVRLARHQVGRPYHFGGDSPAEGFDCSGLVFYTYQRAGIRLPRTSYGQFKKSRPVAMRHLKPGDLVFFQFRRGIISHVGIYIGKHRFIHAPSGGKSVTINSLNDPYWRFHFVRGGRAL